MRPTFFQNNPYGSGGSSPESVVLNFNRPGVGGFNVMYKRGSTWVPGKPKDLLTANEVLINFAYLGGEHFCNYSVFRKLMGSKVQFSFSLNKSTVEGVSYGWDIANAAFALPKVGSASYPGISPICTLVVEVDVNTYEMTYSYDTLQDLYAKSGAYVIQQVWWYGNEETTHLYRIPLFKRGDVWVSEPSEKVAVSADELGNDLFIREIPILTCWGLESSTIISSFDAWIPYIDSDRLINVEAVLNYGSAFNMNSVGSSGLICSFSGVGQTGPVEGSTQYRNLI